MRVAVRTRLTAQLPGTVCMPSELRRGRSNRSASRTWGAPSAAWPAPQGTGQPPAHRILLHHELAIRVVHLPLAQPPLQHGKVGLGGGAQQAQREVVRRRIAHGGGAARVQQVQQGRAAQAPRRRLRRQAGHQLQGCR
jgi:hypothetical protein